MLIYFKLFMSLWVEALSTACYIVNKRHHLTPIELWSEKPADYSDMKIFGCPAYVHIK